MLLAGGQALAAKDPAAARATLRAADAAAPGHLNPPLALARLDVQTGDWDAAARAYAALEARFPARVEPYLGAADLATQRKQPAAAVDALRRAAAAGAQPAWLVAWRLSQADQAAGRPADALQDARAAVAAAPANGTVQDWLAGLYAAAGDDAAAARQEEQAARAPDAPWPWLGHLRAAQAWRRAGDPARAQAEARAAVAAAEQHNAPAHDRAQAYLLLGDILHATGDPAGIRRLRRRPPPRPHRPPGPAARPLGDHTARAARPPGRSGPKPAGMPGASRLWEPAPPGEAPQPPGQTGAGMWKRDRRNGSAAVGRCPARPPAAGGQHGAGM